MSKQLLSPTGDSQHLIVRLHDASVVDMSGNMIAKSIGIGFLLTEEAAMGQPTFSNNVWRGGSSDGTAIIERRFDYRS
jgi:hypothetical protein